MLRRVSVISDSTAVPLIGKNRIRCSGGGSTVMSLMRSSSVWLVFSTLAYQLSLVRVAVAFMAGFLLGFEQLRCRLQDKKKPPEVRRSFKILWRIFFAYAR